MGITKNRWLTAISLIMVLFVATACFQQVGDDAQGQVVSVINSPTSTITPEPTEEASNTPTSSPTSSPTAADFPISNNPTATETATETPTETQVLEVAQAGDEAQLQATPTGDTFDLRATQLIFEATQTAVFPTTQAAMTLIGITNTPIPTDSGIILTDTGTGFIPGADCVHEVRAGENLFRLSLYYGIPVNDIVTRNGIVNANIISIGQRLIISGCGTTGALPPPTSVPTPSVTPFQLGSGGPNLGDPNPGQGGGITTGVGCVSQYTVNQYDTLFQISLQYGVGVQSIANANGITNINVIDMGSVLCIPAQ